MIEIIANNANRSIEIGSVGESGVRAVSFDVSEWLSELGEGSAALVAIRNGDEAAFPIPVSQNGSTVRWVVSAADVAKPGYGKAQLDWIIDGKIAKSAIYRTHTKQSLEWGDTPPEAGQNYLNKVIENANRAEEATKKAPKIVEDKWFVWDAVSGQYVDTGVSATPDLSARGDGDSIVITTKIGG